MNVVKIYQHWEFEFVVLLVSPNSQPYALQSFSPFWISLVCESFINPCFQELKLRTPNPKFPDNSKLKENQSQNFSKAKKT